MGKISDVTVERLKYLFNYDKDSGLFTRLVTKGTSKAGSVASCIQDGYVYIGIDKKRYMAHRLAWLYSFGEWPEDQIDHINGVRTDNRLDNLRQATNAQNQQNRASAKRSTSKHVGVYFHSQSGKWSACIRINGKQKTIGRYDSEIEAAAAYAREKSILHDFNPQLRENLKMERRP